MKALAFRSGSSPKDAEDSSTAAEQRCMVDLINWANVLKSSKYCNLAQIKTYITISTALLINRSSRLRQIFHSKSPRHGSKSLMLFTTTRGPESRSPLRSNPGDLYDLRFLPCHLHIPGLRATAMARYSRSCQVLTESVLNRVPRTSYPTTKMGILLGSCTESSTA